MTAPRNAPRTVQNEQRMNHAAGRLRTSRLRVYPKRFWGAHGYTSPSTCGSAFARIFPHQCSSQHICTPRSCMARLGSASCGRARPYLFGHRLIPRRPPENVCYWRRTPFESKFSFAKLSHLLNYLEFNPVLHLVST